jgi:putative component of membrane protein insertase Oxa1/YidC/SpoIIIJ protein YidD
MKFFLITIITAYQIISPVLKSLLGIRKACRYSLSCSSYAKIHIEKYGIIKGGMLSLKRLLSCQPSGKIQLW